jgi:abortive infection bacteriophage resistance protein
MAIYQKNILSIRLDIRNFAVSLQHQYPPSLLTMLKSAGRFILRFMGTKYTKKCTLPQELVTLLKSRGLAIHDEQKAINYLTNIGYFRLSAYLYPLLKDPKKEHFYKDGTSFSMALEMYRFDRKLRVLLFNEIEKIEVAIRSAMNNIICNGLDDVFWMTTPTYFSSPSIFAKTKKLIQLETGKTKEEFISHFYDTYNHPFPPAWMISEIIPLGVLCNIFNNLKSKGLKKDIAQHFGLSLPAFSSWILILSNLRNLCGHHIRIWNKEIPLVATDPLRHIYPWIDATQTNPKRIYYRICIIKYLLFTVSPNNTFTQKMKSLLAKFPTIDIRAMGFPDDWQDEPLWKSEQPHQSLSNRLR